MNTIFVLKKSDLTPNEIRSSVYTLIVDRIDQIPTDT